MRKYLVAGNWKMHGDAASSLALIDGILAGLAPTDSVDVLVCPPFPYLAGVAERLSEVSAEGQRLSRLTVQTSLTTR